MPLPLSLNLAIGGSFFQVQEDFTKSNLWDDSGFWDDSDTWMDVGTEVVFWDDNAAWPDSDSWKDFQ